MKKIQIVEGIMSIVGKISTVVSKVVHNKKEVVAIENVGSGGAEPVGKLRLKNPFAKKEKEADKQRKEELKKAELQRLEELKRLHEMKEQEDLRYKEERERLEQMKIVHIDKCKKKSELGRRKLADGVVDGNLKSHLQVANGYKNKGEALPLHRKQLAKHKVIYLHQRAPTGMHERREGMRKRGTGT